MNYAYRIQGSKAYYSDRFTRPLTFRMESTLTKNVKGHKLPKLQIVAQVFENEATQTGRTLNDHEMMASRSIEKDCNSTSTFEANGKINHINGASHFAKQKLISHTAGGHETLNEVERTITQGKHGFKIAASSIIQDVASNGYLRFMQGLYKQDHQPSTPPVVNNGLAIVEFLRGKSILITGATGFLAKVLVEKILRVQPDVEQLFLLIKAKDVGNAKDRLQNEIVSSSLFKNLQIFHGTSYQGFMERKLTPIVGDLSKDNLGMDVKSLSELQGKVDIIVNSAASTTFDERYDHALNLNTKGAQRVTDFANKCPRVQLFMHVSTAFVNGERKGVVNEKAFRLGCSIANESRTKGEDMVPDIDVDRELQLVKKKIDNILESHSDASPCSSTNLNKKKVEKKLQQAMKDLGMERAKRFGWQDTYVFTKALGEMLVDSTREKLPVVIIRPSVVESSFKDPFPGWMEGNRMMDPILISYGKGQLPGFLVDPKSVLDVVPVDMVASAMLAAMARHANKPSLEVYQVASSVVNPLVFLELARMSREHFREHPFLDKSGKPLTTPDLQLFGNMESFMDAVTTCSHTIKASDLPSSLTNAKSFLKRHQQLTHKVKQQAAYLASLYQPYTFYGGRFDTSKTQHLFASLSDQEKEVFGFDVGEIDWDTYIKTIHIPGLRKHVLKGRGSAM